MQRLKPRILLGVTSDMSIRLMEGFPQFLANRGWDVHVISSPGPQLDSLAEVAGVTTHALNMARKPAPLADLVALIRWTILLLRLRPDLVSVGTPKAGLLGGMSAWITRVPTRIYLLRGLPLETATGLKLTILKVMERISFATAHMSVAVSSSLSARAVELNLVKSGKIRVLGAGSSNGVNLHRFRPSKPSTAGTPKGPGKPLATKLGLEFGIPIIGFVGRLTEDKGLRHMAEALQILSDRGVDYQLLIVGGLDDSAAREALKRLEEAKRRPIQTGHVQDTAPYYQLMDLLCLPTRREGFPNVVLEASASGIPTVTTDATGAVDSVIDGETGFVTQLDSAHSLANALASLLENAELRRRMGDAARVRVHDQYAQRLVWRNLEDFYIQSLPGGLDFRNQDTSKEG